MRKIRLRPFPIRIAGDVFYGLEDHAGRWVYKGSDRDFYRRDRFYSGETVPQDDIAWAMERVSLTFEQALKDHAPDDCEILSPDVKITLIQIELLSNDRSNSYYYTDKITPFLTAPLDVMFYSFETLDGSIEAFRYSDIKHISFKEI